MSIKSLILATALMLTACSKSPSNSPSDATRIRDLEAEVAALKKQIGVEGAAETQISQRILGVYDWGRGGKNGGITLEVQLDGTFYIHGSSGYTGKYTMTGSTLMMKGDNGSALKFTVKGDTLVQDNGDVYRKR